MNFDGDTITHQYPHPAGLVLPPPERRTTTQRDARAVKGILFAALIGLNGVVWGYVYALWLLG